jgi:hypothetical protein
MREDHRCLRCGLPYVEIDAYGERLNRWQVFATSEWRQLPEDDIAALRAMGSSQRWRRMS